MRARHPRLLGRLYAPVHWDRQAEHGPDEARWSTHPVFASDGPALAARYYDRSGEWRRIADRNGLEDPRRLQSGQVLQVPRIEPRAR